MPGPNSDESLPRASAADLFVVSFGALFFELLLVRWLPTSLYYLGYYKNCVLFATFLGFGLGCATRYRVIRALPWYGLAIAALVLIVNLAEESIRVAPWQTGEMLWPQERETGTHVPMLFLLTATFVIGALIMLPFGQLVGRALASFRPNVGYSINVGASLLGVGAFLALGYLQLGPTVWFVLAYLPILYAVRQRRGPLIANAAGLIATLAILLHFASPHDHWSPYSKITLEGEPFAETGARLLLTNNNGHQIISDLSPERIAKRKGSQHPNWQLVDTHRTMYDSPYALTKPRSVLIVGGGTGNEAAAALRNGVQQVHVVEIDPVISELGRQYHPERPYRDPRVTVFTDDARHYMATTKARYDLIVFGYLDSTSHLSSMSNIRLDNYVYTLESFQQARRLLTSTGLLQVTYYVLSDFVKLRIFLMMERAFEHAPLVYQLEHGTSANVYYFAGPVALRDPVAAIPGMLRQLPSAGLPDLELAIDDWPYMNVPLRYLGLDYLVSLSIMLLLSLAAVHGFILRGEARAQDGALTVMLLLQGLGFMLLETGTITRMALVMGSTWIVTSIAIALVLLSSLMANLLVQRSSSPGLPGALAFTAFGLILNYAVDLSLFLQLSGVARIVLTSGLVYLPILGSSLVFARLFQRSEQPNYHFGVNILGAVLGGMLEYTTLVLGVRSLYLMALAFFTLIAVLTVLANARMRAATA